MLVKELELGLQIVIRILFFFKSVHKTLFTWHCFTDSDPEFFFCVARIIQITLSNALAGPQYG